MELYLRVKIIPKLFPMEPEVSSEVLLQEYSGLCQSEHTALLEVSADFGEGNLEKHLPKEQLGLNLLSVVQQLLISPGQS